MNNNYGNKKTMSKNITRYMDAKGIDRLALCEATGIKYTTLVGWLTEQTYPRIDKIEMLANYFGITKADLVEEPKADVAIKVSEDEYALLETYKQLGDSGKEHLANYASFLLEKGGE